MTVQELANKAFMTRGYLNKLKSGRARLNSDVLHKLSVALGCSPSDIINYNYQKNAVKVDVEKERNTNDTYQAKIDMQLYMRSVLIAKSTLEKTSHGTTEEEIEKLANMIYDTARKIDTTIVTESLADWLIKVTENK